MGCNAWNHRADCDCGWGGDTGGGSGRHPSVLYNIWTTPRYRDLDSYVIPNAHCPVCGAEVFYYQSPYGGKVYFDELGPPWPKHSCTDSGVQSGSGSHRLIAASERRPRQLATSEKPRAPRTGWSPLVVQLMVAKGAFDFIFVESKFNTLGKAVIPVPSASFRNRPLFWRRSPADPSLIQISTIADSAEGSEEISANAPSWLDSEADACAFSDGNSPTPKDWNSIGWAASFAFRSDADPQWAQCDSVDWEWAKVAFERAAESGYWPSLNNLGVMYRDGLGVKVDAEMAITKFRQASQALDPIPLRHLANCYKHGIGTSVDESEASYLEELAALVESERNERK